MSCSVGYAISMFISKDMPIEIASAGGDSIIIGHDAYFLGSGVDATRAGSTRFLKEKQGERTGSSAPIPRPMGTCVECEDAF